MPKIRYPAIKLTDRFISSRKPKAGQRQEWRDAEIKGLLLRLTGAGHKSFSLVALYPGANNPARRALGYYVPPDQAGPNIEEAEPPLEGGPLTLGEARLKARRWKDMIRRGIDPRDELERERERNRQKAACKFGIVAAEFLDKHVKGPAYVELERLAAELRKQKPKLDRAKALRLILADRVNQKLIEQSKKEGIVKKGEAIRMVEAEFVARWRNFDIGEITPAMVSRAVAAIAERGAPFQAYNGFGYINRLYSWAIAAGRYGVVTSPCAVLRAADVIGSKKAIRERVLDDGELRVMWRAAGKLGHPLAPLVRMLILTGQRLHEVADLRWREIDLGKALITIPKERMKADRGHEVPLAPEALKLVKGLDDLRRNPPEPKRAGEAAEPMTSLPLWDRGDHLFSFSRGESPPNSYSKIKKRLDALVEEERQKMATEADEDLRPMERWTFHDLRRTARTRWSALPVEDLVRELAMAHAKPGLHAVYDQHAYQDEKRKLFRLWEAKLLSIVAPQSTEVADLDKARDAKRRGKAKPC